MNIRELKQGLFFSKVPPEISIDYDSAVSIEVEFDGKRVRQPLGDILVTGNGEITLISKEALKASSLDFLPTVETPFGGDQIQ